MQLFRKPALDYQNRLHGEIFLVPPLRWQMIAALLLLLVLGCATALALGSYSRTITAPATVHASPTAWIATVQVPLAQAQAVAPGQRVSLAIDGYPLGEYGAVTGVVLSVDPIVTDSPAPYRPIIVQLPPAHTTPTSDGPILHEKLGAQASINIGEEPLWRWLFRPVLPMDR